MFDPRKPFVDCPPHGRINAVLSCPQCVRELLRENKEFRHELEKAARMLTEMANGTKELREEKEQLVAKVEDLKGLLQRYMKEVLDAEGSAFLPTEPDKDFSREEVSLLREIHEAIKWRCDLCHKENDRAFVKCPCGGLFV